MFQNVEVNSSFEPFLDNPITESLLCIVLLKKPVLYIHKQEQACSSKTLGQPLDSSESPVSFQHSGTLFKRGIVDAQKQKLCLELPL